MVNVVGYIRVSTVNQVKEGYSLGEQLDEIEKYCAANGFNLIHTFTPKILTRPSSAGTRSRERRP